MGNLRKTSGEGGHPQTWSPLLQLLPRGQHPSLRMPRMAMGLVAQRQGNEISTTWAKEEPRAPLPLHGEQLKAALQTKDGSSCIKKQEENRTSRSVARTGCSFQLSGPALLRCLSLGNEERTDL